MNTADWLIVLILVVNVVVAATHGFFSEVLSTGGLIVGYILAAWQYRRLAEWFESFLKNPWLAEILGFLIIFFVVLALFMTASRMARKVMKAAGLSSFDRFLGGVLGLLKGGLMVAVILMGMAAFTPTSKLLANSLLAPYFLVLGQAAKWVAPAELRMRFDQGLELLHQAPQKLPAPARPK